MYVVYFWWCKLSPNGYGGYMAVQKWGSDPSEKDVVDCENKEKSRRLHVNPARYLITGGAGFIGSHIAETLLDQGESVCLFDNFATGRKSNLDALKGRAQFIEGD